MNSLEDLKPSKNKYLKHNPKNKELNKIDEIAEKYLDKKIKLLTASKTTIHRNENQS